METAESVQQSCEFCGDAGSWLVTYPIVATAVLAAFFLLLFRKSFWKQIIFVIAATSAAFLMFVWSFHACGGLQSCSGSGLVILFFGTPVSLINIALITLLTFLLAVMPADSHGALLRRLRRS